MSHAKATFTLLLLISLSNCSREIDCIDPPLITSFISFPQNSLDTLIFRRFERGSNFQTQVDSVYLTQVHIRLIEERGDTSKLILLDPDLYPKPGFDLQIFVPAVNRTISITEITKRDKTRNCATMQMPVNCQCYDEILTLKTDNQRGVLETNAGYNLILR